LGTDRYSRGFISLIATTGATLLFFASPSSAAIWEWRGTAGDGLRSNPNKFGALIESTQPIAVERAKYSSNAAGQVWAAGTNATAVPVP
jgi:hypothetical protein